MAKKKIGAVLGELALTTVTAGFVLMLLNLLSSTLVSSVPVIGSITVALATLFVYAGMISNKKIKILEDILPVLLISPILLAVVSLIGFPINIPTLGDGLTIGVGLADAVIALGLTKIIFSYFK